MTGAEPRARVLILGGGFAGCFVAQRLEKRLGADRSVEVSLVNRDNYFVFQPLLAEVASGQIPVSYTHLTLPTNREV